MATATATASEITPDQARAIVARLRDDPVWFARTILGDDPWLLQRRIMRALTRPQARVAVRACHSSGKTHMAAAIVLWWVARGGTAITTAPTWSQVKNILWRYIRRAHKAARFPLGGNLLQTEYHISEDAYAIGLSTNEGVNFQGFHGEVLIVMDEAPGVQPAIYEAIEGIRAGGDVRQLLLGNPTIASGPFYDAFTRERASWQTFAISAFDTPNLAGVSVEELRAIPPDAADHPLLAVPPARPYLTTRTWVHDRLHAWGEASPLWQARVAGDFPAQSEDALIALGWLELSKYIAGDDGEDFHAAGIDVAGPGEDETVLTIRRRWRVTQLHAYADHDPRGPVIAALAPFRATLRAVNVDSVGQGYYFGKHLEDQGFPVEYVNVGEKSNDPEKYANWKAELYWNLRMLFEAKRIGGLRDDLAIQQLTGIRYRHNAAGQVVIESKEEARKRGVKSPDRAESVMLCFAPPRPKKRVQVF